MQGIDIIRYNKTQTGVDGFGAPIYSEAPEVVHNVLIGEPATEDIVNDLQLYGKRLAYTLAVTEGIEAMIPLRWNRKVKVERFE